MNATSSGFVMAGPRLPADWTVTSDAELADQLFADLPPRSAAPAAGAMELVDGRGVFVRRATAGNPGPQAWYIHGLGGSTTNWTSLAGGLLPWADSVVVDLPGHGRSDPAPRGRYGIIDNAELVATLIRRQAAEPIHLVGNSLGGMVSLHLAARHPDLVASLTLISPAVPDLRLSTDRGADPRLGLLLLPGTDRVADRRLGRLSPLERARAMGGLVFGDPALITEADQLAQARELAWRGSLPWVNSGLIGSLRALMVDHLHRRSFAKAAGAVAVPTLIVWGQRDRLVDVRLAEPTAQHFSDHRLLVLPGVGHTAQLEQPAATARAVLALWIRTGRLRPGAPHVRHTCTVATSQG